MATFQKYPGMSIDNEPLASFFFFCCCACWKMWCACSSQMSDCKDPESVEFPCCQQSQVHIWWSVLYWWHLAFCREREQNQILNSSLLEKIQEEYIRKVKSIEHEHFAAMEPVLARIEVSPSVSIKQAFNTNCALPPSLSLSIAFFWHMLNVCSP